MKTNFASLTLLLGALSALTLGCSPDSGEPPPSESDFTSSSGSKVHDTITGAINSLDTAKFVLESGLLTSLYAKELCSCAFVSNMPDDECLDQVKIPAQIPVIKVVVSSQDLVRSKIDRVKKTVTVDGAITGPIAKTLGFVSPTNPKSIAALDLKHPEFGCRITFKGNLRDGEPVR